MVISNTSVNLMAITNADDRNKFPKNEGHALSKKLDLLQLKRREEEGHS